jgi:UDP-N-acetylglucosamine/UDP-N-acetylgalactosamine diphosphorylase
LCIITSPENDAATRQFFAQHAWFGLDRQQVSYVQQGTMPALDRQTGKLLLAEKHRLATNPNGRGGVLQALASGGRLDDLRQRGIRYLFYCQLDNPLVKVADAEYLGLHIASAAEMSLKVVRKCRLQENLDVLAEVDGKIQLMEHNELPRQLAQRTDARGELEFWAGSIGVHILNVSLLNRLAAGQSVLPYRRVIRKVRYLDESGKLVTPSEPNAMRFKMHIGDALPLARGVLAVETPRGEEFEPPLAPPQKTRPPAYIGMS